MKRGLILLFFVSAAFTATLYAQGDPPPTPTDLTATLEPGNFPGVHLAWDAPSGPWSFRAYRSVDDTTDFHYAGYSWTHEFHDRHVMPGHTYYYYVTSIVREGNTWRESSPSNMDSVTIVPPPPPVRGTISGTVTDDSTGLPIPYVRIRFFRVSRNWCWGPMTYTDSLGQYQAALDTGTYLVKAEPFCHNHTQCYRPEYYDNSPDPSGATPILVTEGSVFVADFGLSRPTPPSYAYVSGTVLDSLGNPLRHASVVFIRTLQEMNSMAALTGMTPGLGEESMNIEGVGHTRGVRWRGWTDSLGNYRARVIADRDYIAMASKFGYLPQYFDHKSNPLDADIIHVTGDTTGIDFDLGLNPVLQNSISGTVRDSLGTLVPSRIVLIPLDHGHHFRGGTRFGHTDSLGAYTLSSVRAGNYFVLALPFSDYAPAFYKAGEYGVRNWRDADTVDITGDITGIDVGVVPIESDGITRVSGVVTSATGSPVEGINVLAISTNGSIAGYTITDRSGRYALDAVSSGPVAIVAGREGYNTSQSNISIAPGTFALNGVNLTVTPEVTTSESGTPAVPSRYTLNQNYPNPFNPSTTITFEIPVASIASLKVYNLLGQEVATLVNGTVEAGSHQVRWNGKDDSGRPAASGIYFYKLQASSLNGATSFSRVNKMLLLK